jgi:hypothetical protein
MTHYGSLGTQAVSEDVRDIRGTDVRGADNTKLGDVTDVIIDHEAMEIRYVVMDSGGWLEAGTFLLPADRMSADETDENNLTARVTRQQIRNSPKYDKNTLHSEDEWKKYEREFTKYWDEEPILHMKDSYRIITPPEEPISAQPTSSS